MHHNLKGNIRISIHSLGTQVEPLAWGKAWLADPYQPHYVAGQQAMERVYGCKPDLTREGGSIPIAITFQVCLISINQSLLLFNCYQLR